MRGEITMKDDARRYVLSAGRTGTVFLENFINEGVAGALAEHEPSPTRTQMMLANLRNDWGIGGRLLKWHFNRHRHAREQAAGGIYVEINPFLCPMTDLVDDGVRPFRLVHMVREPGSWARSICTFKASERFRGVVDYVPFSKPYPAPRPDGWGKLGAFEKALWRWNWCNTRIRALQPLAASYAVVRYEDMFSAELATRQKALTTVFEVLDLDLPETVDWDAMKTRLNPAPPGEMEIDRAAVRSICGPLARELGYEG